MLRFVEGNACSLPQFPDNSFDLVHSNSVIEHVGSWTNMEAFAREVRRLAPRYYVQTPYQWFPFEPHWMAPFVHWLSVRARARWVMTFRKAARGDYGWAMRAIQAISLLDKTEMRYLFSDARHLDERFLGLTKSLLAIRSPD
jgi:ubiquinone/menaquinone biosynthesis C-methylase UbiE